MQIIAECRIENGLQIVTPFFLNSPDCLYTKKSCKFLQSYGKTTIGLNRVELSDTLYNILCEDKVLSQFSIKEYEQDDYRDYYKIEENENEYNVSIWVRSIKKNEYNIKHRMEWVLYCLPYVKQQPVDFTADIPYIPLADGCGCLFF